MCLRKRGYVGKHHKKKDPVKMVDKSIRSHGDPTETEKYAQAVSKIAKHMAKKKKL